jgi:hypothetical protein
LYFSSKRLAAGQGFNDCRHETHIIASALHVFNIVLKRLVYLTSYIVCKVLHHLIDIRIPFNRGSRAMRSASSIAASVSGLGVSMRYQTVSAADERIGAGKY